MYNFDETKRKECFNSKIFLSIHNLLEKKSQFKKKLWQP